MFFYVKKNQKTFYYLNHCQLPAWRPINESFLLLFYKIEALPFLAQPPGAAA
jgi:hypothetical protein